MIRFINEFQLLKNFHFDSHPSWTKRKKSSSLPHGWKTILQLRQWLSWHNSRRNQIKGVKLPYNFMIYIKKYVGWNKIRNNQTVTKHLTELFRYFILKFTDMRISVSNIVRSCWAWSCHRFRWGNEDGNQINCWTDETCGRVCCWSCISCCFVPSRANYSNTKSTR